MTVGPFHKPPDVVPSGAIQPFYGSQSAVPEGWVVCDGNNGAPDLRNKFVKSTSTASELPGSIGGSNSRTLAVGQLPSHNHGGSTPSAGAHEHSDTGYDSSKDSTGIYDSDYPVMTSGGKYSATSRSAGGHDHTGVSFGSTGSGNSIENKPSYTETLFIKKL